MLDRALFISDLHLCENEAVTARLFFDFLETHAASASSLYILGDLFDAWAGDDDLADPFNLKVVTSLRQLSDSGVALSIMHGNRDFLMGPQFFEAAGACHIPDPWLCDIFGEPTLLVHGDTLCTADVKYQSFRQRVRNEAWQADFLAQPLDTRKAAIRELRRQSEVEKPEKAAEIMDVDPAAVDALLRENACARLIHGHIHRPGRHIHVVDSRPCERWVLGDWHEDGAACIHCRRDGIGFLDAKK
ncbi:MAG: UDP-2,3-diacylglucosamine diphosphatase [Burkholderiales bacterium]|nr:UDP-2,3-diacylglucosamine diphosphatase [Burkholderiales bacterium]